jgi:HAD superfamily hydrolase (TIGR01450 family)
MRSLAEVDAFLLDMDGTLYVDDALQPRARELLELLAERGARHLFLTNNSSARGSDYEAKLERLGLPPSLVRGHVLTSGEATARHLARETRWRRIFLLGTPSLAAELRAAGLELDERDPECVVLGFDKTLTYDRLARACLLIAAGLPYVATHPDFTCITSAGLIPDAGAFIVGIERVTGRLPKVVGKPEPEMVAAALERLGGGAVAARTAMVGDQLDTDMAMAARAGLYGVLVLSGETSRERLAAERGARPDLVVGDIGELCERLAHLPM